MGFNQVTTRIAQINGETLFDSIKMLMEIDVIQAITLENKGSSIKIDFTNEDDHIETIYDKIEYVFVKLAKEKNKTFVMFSMACDFEGSPWASRRGVINVIKNGKVDSSFDFFDVTDGEVVNHIVREPAMRLAETIDSLLPLQIWESNVERFEDEFAKGDFTKALTLKTMKK